MLEYPCEHPTGKFQVCGQRGRWVQDLAIMRCHYHERLIRLWMRLDKQRREVERQKYRRIAVLEELPVAGPLKPYATEAKVRYVDV